MGKLKSGIVLKDRIYVPDYDNHNKMLKELGIINNIANAVTTFVKFELSPSDNNIFSDVDTWELSINQEYVPNWWNEEEFRPKIVNMVKVWAEKHIHNDGEDLKISSGVHYVKNSSVYAYENSVIRVYGTSSVVATDTVTVMGNGMSTITAYNNSEVIVGDRCIVKAYENSKVEVYNKSSVDAYENSVVKAYDNSIVVAHDKSTIEAYNGSMAIAYNDSVVEAFDSSVIRAFDNSNIKAYGCSVVFDAKCSINHNITLFDKAICRSENNQKLYQADDWEFVEV